MFVASLTATAALAAPVLASAAEDDWPILKSHRIEGTPPWGAFVVYPQSGASVGVSLYLLAPKDGPAALTARRVRVEGEAAARIDWAAAPGCPALSAALAKLEELPPPRIDVPGVGRDAKGSVVADGASYFLWSSLAAYSGGAIGELEVRTVDGTPAAAWIDETLKALEPCWGPPRP